jgi:hypothetical protein
MNSKFFRPRDLLHVAGWICLGIAAYPDGAAFLWMLIAPVYLIALAAKAVMWLIPATRGKTSLRLMWLGPAVFLALLPIYVYRFNAARNAGDQVVMSVDQYRHLHGIYPASERALGLDPRLKQIRHLYYDDRNGQPVVAYASPLIPFDTYYFDFDRRAWIYRPD